MAVNPLGSGFLAGLGGLSRSYPDQIRPLAPWLRMELLRPGGSR